MASHYHHHGHHQTTTCCNFSCPCSHCCNPPPPPSVQTTDSLLQPLASLLLQHHSLDQPHFKRSHQNQSFPQHKPHFHRREENPQDVHFLLSSLLSRIEALEFSLHHISTYNAYGYPSRSLRDAAARVIQTHFRAFFVRRSKTLRQLKELALIKSRLYSLKQSISNKTRFDLEAVSRKAMDLLVTLDSIQGGDPMIRDGKRSIRGDLLQFLEFIDEIAPKGHKVHYRAAKNVSFVANNNKSRVSGPTFGEYGQDRRREVIERLRNRVEKNHRCSRVFRNGDEDAVELEGFCPVIDEVENPRISINGKTGLSANGVLVGRQVSQPKVNKTVSFAGNGNVYRVFSNGSRSEHSSSGEGTLTDESVSSDDQGEIKESYCKGAENEEAQMEKGESVQSSDEERSRRGNLRNQYRSQTNEEDEDGAPNLMFFAPLPVKMESSVDLNKIKGVKIAS